MKILGISGGFEHDAAAALVIDGNIVASSEEERFTRTKRALRQPASHSIEACLDAGGIAIDEIDYLAIGWDPTLAPQDRRLSDSLARLVNTPPFYSGPAPEAVFVAHHRAHAAMSFYTSGLSEAAVLIVDGQGEDVATTIFRASGTTLTELARFDIRDSLGFFFTAVTRYLGFTPGSAGKTMGLGALGKPTYGFPELGTTESGYFVDMPGATKGERMARWLRRLEDVFGPPPARTRRTTPQGGAVWPHAILLGPHADAAASAQAALDRILMHLAPLAMQMAGSANLVFGGGVALNCSTNGKLRAALGASLSVNGAVHDGGTALGAALLVAASAGELGKPTPLRDMFLGPSYPVGTVVDRARRVGLTVSRPAAGTAEAASGLLSQSRIGGWYQGRMELGPRALGGRSIIARADDRQVSNRVNAIKGREAWRPLAPVLSPGTATALALGSEGLDFMVEARWLADVPALAGVLHVDNSVRPLVPNADDHPFSRLVEAIEAATGTGALTNTSFNTEHEPIVCSPADALRTFVSSDLDFLVLDDVLITKQS